MHWLTKRMALASIAVVVMTGCDREPAAGGSAGAPGGAATAAGGALTEDAVKQFVTRKEQNLATGVGSSHKSVAVDFSEVRIGATRAPNEQDKIDGIRGDTVYPVRVKYTSNRTWGNGETEAKVIHYGYDFYRDEFGEWNAVGRGPVN